MQFDYLVFIGRFQPFHVGHFKTVQEALLRSEKVIIILGSDNNTITVKNPFTSTERQQIILSCFTEEERARILFATQRDYLYNDDKWVPSIISSVNTIAMAKYRPDPIRIGIIGHQKDDSSYYLNLFPDWKLVPIEAHSDESGQTFDGTNIRRQLYDVTARTQCWEVNDDHYNLVEKLLNPKKEYLRKQFLSIIDYKTVYGPGPFVATDVILKQNNRILVIRRKDSGLTALPGGFLEPCEFIVEGANRELIEETTIKLNDSFGLHQFLQYLKKSYVFDHPNRDLRARIISHCYLVEVPEDIEVTFSANDDAKDCFWLNIKDLNKEQWHGDHRHMIEYMLDLI